MKTKRLLKKLKGIQTIETVMDNLEVNKNMAVYYIYSLRKKGYVKTERLSNNKRVYRISFENRLGGKSYSEIINKHSPVKISEPVTYQIYGKELSAEEVLIYAVKTKSFRTILASLSLFKKIKDWPALYRMSKENKIERKIGALYDTARKIILTKRMTSRFKTLSLPKKGSKWEFIIPKLKSDYLREIEKKWKIYLPFGRKDLEVYKK